MAGYSINRISADQRIFVTSLPTAWKATGTTLGYSALVEKYSGLGSLTATVTNGDLIVYNRNLPTNDLPIDVNCKVTSSDIGDTVEAFFWIKSDARVTATFTCKLIWQTANSPYSASSSSTAVDVLSGEWTLVKLDTPVTIPTTGGVLVNDYAISFEIAFSNIATDADINISGVGTYCTRDFMRNPILLNIYRNLPLYVREQDMLTELGNRQLARFLEMMIIHQGEIQDLTNKIAYIDISQGKDEVLSNTLSHLVDPDTALYEYLLWLAQFTGTNVINPTTGNTPWINLPSTWEGIDQIDDDDPDPLQSVVWTELQNYDPTIPGLDLFIRWQIKNGYYGYAAGTQQAIEESVKRVLSGTKTVNYSVTAPWEVLIETKIGETPDAGGLSVGDPVPPVLALMEPARPLGVNITHELIS